MLYLLFIIAIFILAEGLYEIKQGKKLTGTKGILFCVSAILVFLLIIALWNTPTDDTDKDTTTTVEEEYAKENTDTEEEEVIEEPKLDPIDTSNIYVYVSFYNGAEVYGGHVHEDYNCGFCKKKVFGDPLDVKRVSAGQLAKADSKYEHIGFCPWCSRYSDYYLNGEPRK